MANNKIDPANKILAEKTIGIYTYKVARHLTYRWRATLVIYRRDELLSITNYTTIQEAMKDYEILS